MTKHRKPREPDPNLIAKSMIDRIAARTEGRPEPEEPKEPEKNPAAVELGRLGGKKGGPARSKKLTKKQQSEIAKKASASRWSKD